MEKFDKKALLAVVAELNEKRDAGIKNPAKMSVEQLVAAIMEATEDGENVTKLNKASRATVQAILDAQTGEEEGDDAGEDGEGTEEGGDNAGEEGEEGEDGDTEDSMPEDLTSREAMNIAAHDMNEVMGLEPGIDTSAADKAFNAAFKKAANMAQATDAFSDYTWSVLEAVGMGPERAKAAAPAKKADKKSADKKQPAAKPGKTEKKDKAPKEPKEPKGPGVIATIIDFVDSTKGKFTRADIHAKLVKAFPDRDENALMATVKTQVPGRLSKEKGYVFTKDGENFTVKPPKK